MITSVITTFLNIKYQSLKATILERNFKNQKKENAKKKKHLS